MAEVQNPQLLLLDAGQLAAARARKFPEYAKKSLARARLSVRQGTDSSGQIEPSSAFTELNDPFIIPPLPPITDLNGQPMVEDVNMLDIPADAGTNQATRPQQEDDVSDQEEREEFESVQKWFNALKSPTMADNVCYAAAKRKLDIRNSRSESRNVLQEEEQAGQPEQIGQVEYQEGVQKVDNELFVPQDPVLLLLEELPVENNIQPVRRNIQPEIPAQARMPVKKRCFPRISAEEKRKSMEVGFEPIRERLQTKNKRRKVVNMLKDNNTNGASMTGYKRGQKKNNERGDSNVLLSLKANVIKEAHTSSALPRPTSFTASNRKNAMAELVASIPTKDRDEAKENVNLITNAMKKFTRSVITDNQGGWRIKGLKTKMYHYQVLGCAFMRDRENSPEEPRGGILADVMGIGKTLEALVNIIDGLPLNPEDQSQTTLLVVPSHLTKHWMDQMRKHCEPKAIGKVVQYHARAKLSTLNDIEDLQTYSIVVTTYDEVRRSYPTFKPPKELSNEERLREQWGHIFKENRGPLHRIKFHRIVLDEAHIIKNWKSSVSIAVRGLVGQYKWLLSGTPVMNYNEEFYPLFSFLNVPGIGDHANFMSYYRDDELGNERLSNLLKAYMMRRTHASRLFTLPIIQLPDIKESRVDVEFSEAEWVMYQAIEQMFFERINELGNESHFKAAQCRCCLTMILRLRMFCSHPLTVQHLLKDFLVPHGSLMGQLSKISRNEGPGSADSSANIVSWLMAAKNNYNELVKQRREEQLDQMGDNQIFTINPNLIQRFHELGARLAEENDWIEQYDRTICPKCQYFSDKTVVTSCLHLYCEECFGELHMAVKDIETAYLGPEISEKPKPICLKCATPIEEATRCSMPQPPVPGQPTTPAARRQRRKELTVGKGKAKKNGNFEAENNKEDEDWIRACGAKMPGAKLIGIKNIIKKWKTSSENTKVVIFSQFTDFVRILAEMCQEERWGFRCLYGQMRITARHKSLEDFENNPDITILIVSLYTGGTGLDMTVAQKCILVDLWWNEAVQNQAFCRLLRHGQTKDVECVKMIVKGTIDDYMLDLQIKKTEDIKSTMGNDALKKRDTVVTLLKLFADVDEDGSGRLYVKPKRGRNRQGKMKEALSLGRSHCETK
ncbi:SNF2 family N-terminal domain-containing protein [Aspergillus varians]